MSDGQCHPQSLSDTSDINHWKISEKTIVEVVYPTKWEIQEVSFQTWYSAYRIDTWLDQSPQPSINGVQMPISTMSRVTQPIQKRRRQNQ